MSSPILTGMGAPVTPTILEELGGNTITSAPIPACRERESFSMPTERPTISRMSVTSRAMARMLMAERTGRCARLDTIILFIMSGTSSFVFRLRHSYRMRKPEHIWCLDEILRHPVCPRAARHSSMKRSNRDHSLCHRVSLVINHDERQKRNVIGAAHFFHSRTKLQLRNEARHSASSSAPRRTHEGTVMNGSMTTSRRLRLIL